MEVEVGGHWDAYQVVSLHEFLVVGQAGDFAGGLDFAVGGSGGDEVDVEAEAALGGADQLGAAGDDGKDGVFEGRDAFRRILRMVWMVVPIGAWPMGTRRPVVA